MFSTQVEKQNISGSLEGPSWLLSCFPALREIHWAEFFVFKY